MGQKNQLFVTVNAREDLAAIGVAPAAAAAFRAVAMVRGRELADAYQKLFTAAWSGEGVMALPPRWRSPWPRAWRDEISWRRSRALAIAGLARVHSELGGTAAALVRCGRVHLRSDTHPHTRPSRFGPPRVFTRFTGDSETPLVLAHELGHAVQMTHSWLGPSRPSPHFAAAEIAAHVAERGFHRIYAAAGAPRAAAARIADDMLTMLVRHPTRDAMEHSGADAWASVCAAFAPDLAWSADPPPTRPRGHDEPLSTLGYAMAATLANVLFARIEADAGVAETYLHWVRRGPAARFEDAGALIGARIDDPALYDAGYAIAIRELEHAKQLA